MEQLKLFEKDYESKVQHNFFTTPCQIPKNVIIPSSSSKRSLFQEEKERQNISDTESDIGPISPLALTDHSSCDSSPGKQFISSHTTDKLSMVSVSNYNHLKETSIKNNNNELIASSNYLKRFIKSINKLSPESKLYYLNKEGIVKTKINLDLSDGTILQNDIVPETPNKEFEINDKKLYSETPQKEKKLEYKLTTPLGSVSKSISIPKIYKRKCLVSSECDIRMSPEIKKCMLKRHSENSVFVSNIMYQKTDESPLVPKARAALFQEHKVKNQKEKELTLNSKSFYGSNEKSLMSVGLEWREPQSDLKKRRSLSSYNILQKRSLKKHKNGEINCGVRHGIKRSKPKRQFVLSNKSKVERQNDNFKNQNNLYKENLNPQNKIIQNHHKRIFKYKHDKAVVTVIDNVKLKVALDETKTKYNNKNTKFNKHLFDASDLSETIVEPLLEENKVVNILKILENDWTDDNDTMETTQAVCFRINNLSPKLSNVGLKDMTTSPASELSNMASIMNIEDISICTDDCTEIDAGNFKLNEISNSKFYPLFSKSYTSNIINEYRKL
jgi:hypothetical protein